MKTTRRRPAATPVSAPTLTENNEKDGLEIRFPSKPAAEVLERLKAAGWRWSRFSSCWYTRRTEAARRFAVDLLGLATDTQEATPSASEDVLVCLYEDGQRRESSIAEWQEANHNDDEAMEALVKLLSGETVTMGGGAQPLCRMWIESRPPVLASPRISSHSSPRAEDYPCSDLGFEDACAAACGPGL